MSHFHPVNKWIDVFRVYSVHSFQRLSDLLPCILLNSLIFIFAKSLVINTGVCPVSGHFLAIHSFVFIGILFSGPG